MDFTHIELKKTDDKNFFMLTFQLQHDTMTFITPVIIQENTFMFGEVFHHQNGRCPHCLRETKNNQKTVCLHFLLVDEQAVFLDRLLQNFIETKRQDLKIDETYQKRLRVQGYQSKKNQLNRLANAREESILFYTNTFTKYVAKKGRKMYYVTLEETLEKYQQIEKGLLIEARELHRFEKKRNKSKYVVNIEQKEKLTLAPYYVSERKGEKMAHLLTVAKHVLSIYEPLKKMTDKEENEELLKNIFEVLIREMNITFRSNEEYFEIYEETIWYINGFIDGEINLYECIGLLVKDPHRNNNDRKDKIALLIRAMRCIEKMNREITVLLKENKEAWLEQTFHKLFHVIRLELNLPFMSLEKRNRIDREVFFIITDYIKGTFTLEACLTHIHELIPFFHKNPLESINEFLIELSAKKSTKDQRFHYVFTPLLFQGNVTESLQLSEEYTWLKELRAQESEFWDGDVSELTKWMDTDDIEILRDLTYLLVYNAPTQMVWKVTLTPNFYGEENSDEYIFFNGNELYRLHFRVEDNE